MLTSHPPWFDKNLQGVSGLMQLSVLLDRLTGPPSFEWPKSTEDDPLLRDCLSKCCMKDKQHRWTATELLQHAFVAETDVDQSLEESSDITELRRDIANVAQISSCLLPNSARRSSANSTPRDEVYRTPRSNQHTPRDAQENSNIDDSRPSVSNTPP
jgi:serine/threonine protein kinase